ncbi:MAG: glutamate--tRNA ligase [Bdellovibrionaceae bacterium]|nr:glutamate--tRNA ligase [Bdellovibrio sp.]
MSALTSEIRVRFAPSPTGYLHVGGARSALFNYLYAKHNGGKFILRIEDTDQARSTKESLKMMISDLKWLGILWDEGPDTDSLIDKGPYGPYKQSERLEIYKKHAEELLARGKAYYCFMSDAELEAEREKIKASGLHTHVESPYADGSIDEAQVRIANGDKAVVRFKTRELRKDYILKDLIRGEVKFPSDMVGDFVLLRSDGMPVYNFCCAVDDYHMKISHILRAEEHLPNTLRQMMIYEGLGWALPQFGHISLILDDDRQKLSKRKGAVACDQFKKEGYLPSAMNNYMALLGWSHPEDKEIMSLEDMKAAFTLERVHASGAVFDRVKLKWMNAQHLRALPNAEIWKLIAPFLQEAGLKLPTDSDWQQQSVETFKSYLEILSDAITLYTPLDDSKYEIFAESDETLKMETTKPVLQAWKELVTAHAKESFTEAEFLQIQDGVKDKTGQKGKNLFFPIRVALIGKPNGAELKILVPLMNKKSILARAEQALAKC